MNRRTAAKKFLTYKPVVAKETSGLPVANELSIDVLCKAIAWYLHYGDDKLRKGEYTLMKIGNELVIHGVPGDDIVGKILRTEKKELVIRVRAIGTIDDLRSELSHWQPMEAYTNGA